MKIISTTLAAAIFAASNAYTFPISVWYQNPVQAGLYYGGATTQAAATKAINANIMLGFPGSNGTPTTWPETFGTDHGQLALLTSIGIEAIGPLSTDYNSQISATSVASVLKLISTVPGSGPIVSGYNLGDEPNCTAAAGIPGSVAAIKTADSTRIVTYNQLSWMLDPQWQSCLSTLVASMQATDIASADDYPVLNAYTNPLTFQFTKSDFNTTSNDVLWRHAAMVAAIRRFALPGQKVWAYQDTGNDALGFSEANNHLGVSITAGSTMVAIIPSGGPGWPSLTSRWVGMGLSGAGIPVDATILSIIDTSHLTMSAPATTTVSSEYVAIVGGVHNSDCIVTVNLCLVNGNEYRATPSEVAAEAWATVISDGNGIEWFPQDLNGYAWALGDQNVADPIASTAAAANLAYIDQAIQNHAPAISSPTIGICSMQLENYTTGVFSTVTSCSNGILTMATSDAAVPGLAMVKSQGNTVVLFAQSDRRSVNGATFKYTLAGHGRQTATVTYDTNRRYDNLHSSFSKTFVLDASGSFYDTLGANGNNYQTKIYRVH